MDRNEQRRLYYNLCNPEQPLPPDNERNVDIDSLGDPDQPVRGLNWTDKLAESIEFSVADPAVEKPACLFFTGLPGSGKSTEILRLAKRLSQKERANLLTVVIDAERVLDITDSIDVSDIYVAVVYQVERRVLEAEGRDPDNAMKDGVLVHLCNMIERLSVTEAKAQIAMYGASLALEMKAQPTLRQEIRRRVAAHTTAFLREARRELIELRERAKNCGYSGVVVLFDSLEKLRGTSTNFADVLDSAERLFSSEAPYLQLPLHVLYTIPPSLILRLLCRVEYMPMIKLWQRDGTRRPFVPGFTAARAMIEKRVPDREALRWFFGASTDDELETRVGRLIEWSAGYPREIVRLLRGVILQAPLTDAKFRRLLGQAGDDYRRLLLISDLDWLARVALEHTPLPKDEAQRQAADRMFANSVVLRYQNDSEWYEVHPAVRDMPLLKEAMERVRAESRTKG